MLFRKKPSLEKSSLKELNQLPIREIIRLLQSSPYSSYENFTEACDNALKALEEFENLKAICLSIGLEHFDGIPSKYSISDRDVSLKKIDSYLSSMTKNAKALEPVLGSEKCFQLLLVTHLRVYDEINSIEQI